MSTNKPITMLDGGFGRELYRLGYDITSQLWSAQVFYDKPEIIQAVHENFAEAGCQILTTNTYGITPYNLKIADKEDDLTQLLDLAYTLANNAKAKYPHTKIAASIPPLTETYRPDMLLDEATMNSQYTTLIEAAVRHNADIILGETLSSIAEMKAITAITAALPIPTWISYTVDLDGHLRSGESLFDATNAALDAGVTAVLANCGGVPEITLSVGFFQELAKTRPFTYGAYANRFTSIPKDHTLADGMTELDREVTPDAYANAVRQWIDMGIGIVGGCCGIGVDYMGHVADVLSEARVSRQ